jgi:hypothetical protein
MFQQLTNSDRGFLVADYHSGSCMAHFLGRVSSARKQGATSLAKIPRTLVGGLT